MKSKILSIFLLSFISIISFTSCDNDAKGTLYNGNNNLVSFASTVMQSEISSDDKGIIKIPLYRGSKSGELSVEVKLSSTNNFIKLVTPTVNFKNNETLSYVIFSFGDINSIDAVKTYEATVSISNPEIIAISGTKDIKVKFQRKLTWEPYGEGVYTSEAFEISKKVKLDKAKEGNIFRINDCITQGFPFVFVLSENQESLLSWTPQPTGYTLKDYGMLFFSPSSMTRNGNTLEFTMQGLIVRNEKFIVAFKDLKESLTLPKK